MYFITCFDQNWFENQRRFFGEVECPRDSEGRAEYLEGASRTFGYFADRARALVSVARNEYDLHECRYVYCVVEYLPEGIHPLGADLDAIGANEAWFAWQVRDQRWVPIERPPVLAQVAGGFALG